MLFIFVLFAGLLSPRYSFCCPKIYGINDTNCDGKLTIVAFGDSITYGIGAPSNKSYPAQIKTILPRATVYNYGIPGENTAQGVTRAKGLFRPLNRKADYVILLEGVNDWGQKHSFTEVLTNLFIIRNYALNTGARVFIGKLTPVFDAPPLTQWALDFNQFMGAWGELPFDILTPAQMCSTADCYGHPNAMGYTTMAALVINALLDY